MWLELQREADMPLWRQIYQALKEQMLSGVLATGAALPATRDLAQQLGVSRNTVCAAYEMLVAEGFLISRPGAAARVAEGLCMEVEVPAPLPIRRTETPLPVAVSFCTGRPDLALFPRYLWQQLLREACRTLPLELYGYSGPQGLPLLRQHIAAWLLRGRGLRVDADDIFVTAGATHGLGLIAEVLRPRGNTVAMEDPCHVGMRRAWSNLGFAVKPVPADAQGLRPDGLTADGDMIAIYTTPSHQFPLGGILPAARRAALVRFAREQDVYLVEDDYDSEFRYAGDPVAPLYALDPQRVFYVGTFSKALFPALRIGYVIVPRPLQRRWCHLRAHMDVQNPPFEQAALAQMLCTGKLDRHVRRMRGVYAKRRRALLEALHRAWGDAVVPCGDAAGLHVAVQFTGMRFDRAFQRRCIQAGVYVKPLEDYCIVKGRHGDKLLLGYGHLTPEEIQTGVDLLAEVINNFPSADGGMCGGGE